GFEHFRAFTLRSFIRVYPRANRLDSSNMDPIKYWHAGVQMVALNYQHLDHSVQVNHGLFLQNGNCGYVQKSQEQPLQKPQRLSIQIYSGHLLPQKSRDAINAFVHCDLIVPSQSHEALSKRERLDTIKAYVPPQGVDAVWSELQLGADHRPLHLHTFKLEITTPQLSFLSFTVKDKQLLGESMLCFATVPIDCLKQGFRYVGLYDPWGKALTYSHLFVYVELV
ncbi:Inactive phospholipase C-like protein 2, partial [Kappamyces sp. JEL0680]